MIRLLLALTLSGTTVQVPLDAQSLARRLMAMWETGDTSELGSITTQDFVYEDVPNGRVLQGAEEGASYIAHVHSWATDVDVEITAVHSGEHFAVAEWTMTGVQDRPIPGRVPVATDRRFSLRGSTLVQVRDGKIVRAADYIDVLGFVLQLGARVELPGGVTIPPEPK